MKTKEPKPPTKKPNSSMIALFKDARNAAAPLVAIRTPDPAATVHAIAKSFNGQAPVLFEWDTVRGVRPVFPQHKPALNECFPDAADLRRPDETLERAVAMPDDSVLFMHNAHRYLEDKAECAPTIQAAWNLRDQFKSNGRTLVLLAPYFTLPAELANDTVELDEPLPDAEQLRDIATDLYASSEDPKMRPPTPDDGEMVRIVDAVSGLAAFPAEQAMAMSLRKSGMDIPALWERKRQMVEQTPGLSVWRGGGTFDDLGGLDNLKGFGRKIINGKNRPRVVVFIDEIEKSIASPDSVDANSVNTDQLGEQLKFMQDNDVEGIILIGPPGTGKSQIAKLLGNEAGCPTVVFDMGGMKGSLMGQSEQQIRNSLKVCKAIGRDKILFIATCNSIGKLPPELRRRYTLGTFFMDLPDTAERAVIWKIYRTKYGIADDNATPPDEGWTGSEIRVCCKNADAFGITLEESARYIVPVAKAAQDKIERLRDEANNCYISASKPGIYEKPTEKLEPAAAGKTGRKMTLRDDA
jgi:hypothetical protein